MSNTFNILNSTFNRVRGQLGTIITVSVNFGILLIFIAGNFLLYHVIIFCAMAIPAIFLAAFVFFPESPHYLMLIDEPKKAENALEVYRNCRDESRRKSAFYLEELQKLKTNSKLAKMSSEVKSEQDKITIGDFCK